MGRKNANRVHIKKVSQPAVNPLAGLTIPPEEMIHFPPKPDSNISYPWPFNVTDHSGLHTIYPTYLDKTKTVKLGRIISLDDAVENPNVVEIATALKHLKMRHVLQPYKGYPRDTESRWDNLGRVLVDLNSTSATKFFKNKKELVRDVARMIPDLEIRKKRLLEEERKRKEEKEEEERKKREEAAKSKGGGGAGGTGVSKKKKGRKKK